MFEDHKHRSFLSFIRKIVDVPVGYSKDDLAVFRSIALRDYHSLVPLIDEYLRLAERADTEVVGKNTEPKTKSTRKQGAEQMHLFDLLRQRKLFPLNEDLSEFAGRVLPNMSRYRFDKMSRADIAARIIEYLEDRDPSTRQKLEASMRDAMSPGADKAADRRSFLSKWEKIIKETQL